ncbi:heterokaryon incompatibility protein-domain-containing protein [Phaeosphaeriaceae sp. PMI808]|nr:heterokaryon incompatibility protein-domain-containing protein [Phaeosphaeriaceae sp. PMI808]
MTIIPEPSGEVRCHLKNAYLDDDMTPEYRAVSYVWGSPTPLKRISINGRFLKVRENLYAFFEAFRARLYKFRSDDTFKDEEQWLWVDQICIDQLVVKERNHQVKMMSDIYRKALYVYVWLGPSDTNIEKAIRILKFRLRDYYEYRTAHPSTRKGKRHQAAEAKVECNTGNDLCIQPTPPPFHALKCFFENKYWQRLWIAQEIMLARYIRIICGETLLSWDELSRFCLSSMLHFPIETQECVPRQMIWFAKHALSAKTYTYTNLLATFSTSQCSVPNDKVYGLQGLLAPEMRIEIDYAQSISDTFQEAIRLLRKDARPADPAQLGLGLEQLDYTQPADQVLLETSLALNAEVESIIGLPLVTTIVDLGTGMTLDTQQRFVMWVHKEDFGRIQSIWTEITQYYVKERIRNLHGREYIEDTSKGIFWWDPILISLVSDLHYEYNLIGFLLDLFLDNIIGVEPNLKRDIAISRWKARRGHGISALYLDDEKLTREYQHQLIEALERTAFRVIAEGRKVHE